jgi:V8-like Glu-specific endopeptidase
MALCVSATASSPFEEIRAPGYRTDGVFDRAAHVKSQQQLHDWLTAHQVAAGLIDPISITVTRQERKELAAADCEGCKKSPQRLLVGLTRSVSVNIDFSDLRYGATRSSKAGVIWTGAAESAAATAMRIHFTSFNLPPGTELYIYNSGGEAFGPYTGAGPLGTGDFWSNTVSGPMVVIQLHHVGSAESLHNVRFEIAELGHIGPKFLQPFMQSQAKTICPDNAHCIEDASCHSTSATNNAKDAVAHMQWVQGAWIYMCSGGLVADTIASETPYFLTANHCLSRAKPAESLECYFQYATSSCGGACYDPVGTCPRTLGASVLATNKTGDYTLLQLSETPPSGSYYLGWSTTAVAYSGGTDLYRISHPSGSPQAYSEHIVDDTVDPCAGWPRGSWIYSTDVVGATEGGSSGSPVLNSNGDIVGQLTGGCGYNLDDVCDYENNWTVDGAFASYYPAVEPWLDPGGGCTDADGDGYCPEDGDCDDTDPDVNPGATEICDDLIDNDCDGAIDGDDSDCATCLPPGELCASDDECCSNKCVGKPGSGTCK